MGARGIDVGRDRPLRIAIFTNNYLPRLSGVAVAVDFLERALREAGHSTLIVAPEYGEACEREAPEVRRVRSLLFTPDAALPLPILDSPFAAVERFAPDLVHVQHPFILGAAGHRVARRLGVPLVYTFHTLYEAFLRGRAARLAHLPALLRAHVDRFVRRCDLVVAPTEPIRREIERSVAGAPPTASLPTGLDPRRFTFEPDADRPALRRELGLPERGPLLLWAGRLAPEKEPELAVDALAALVARGFEGALAFLGRGRAASRLAAQARAAGIGDRVHFCGRLAQGDLLRALSAGDLFLFTSASDTQGIVLYEAWATGLPIVAVESLAAQAVVENGVNGLRVDPTGAALAAAVTAVLAGGERFRAPFPWEVYGPRPLATRWESLYRSTLAAAAVPTTEARATRAAPRLEPVPSRAAPRPLSARGSLSASSLARLE